jgi:hypothetical protein
MGFLDKLEAWLDFEEEIDKESEPSWLNLEALYTGNISSMQHWVYYAKIVV